MTLSGMSIPFFMHDISKKHWTAVVSAHLAFKKSYACPLTRLARLSGFAGCSQRAATLLLNRKSSATTSMAVFLSGYSDIADRRTPPENCSTCMHGRLASTTIEAPTST